MSINSNTKDDFYVDDEERLEEAAAENEETEAAEENETDENTGSDLTQPEPKLKRGLKKALKTVLIIFIVLILICAGLVIWIMRLPQDRVFGGITCSGINMGGMTYQQALTALEGKMNVEIPKISVKVESGSYDISSDEIKLMPLAEETAKKVFYYAKGDNAFINAYNAVKLMANNVDILPVTTLDEESLKVRLAQIGNEALGELKPHTVIMANETTARLVPGNRGFDGNTDTAVEEIKAAIAQDIYLNIPITLKIGDPAPLTVDEVKAAVNVEPKDAAYAVSDGTVVVNKEKAGIQIDEAACSAAVARFTADSDPVDIPCTTLPAAKTADVLKTKVFNYVLGTYSTTYAAGGNRGSNVANAARRINGAIILPGETFSFNKTVGKRSEANGFKSAPEYQNGSTVTGIGGGTCQVSTTLYSAVLYADLKIVSRRNHSMSVGYVPLGQDATVTDGGIDFKFKNDTDYPVKIEALTSGGKITVKIIGTEPEIARTVKITHTKTGESAIKTTRTVYDSDGNVLKTDNIGTSKYKPHE